MQVSITARHLDLTSSLADYVQKRLDRVARHFRSVVRTQVILTVEKHRHIAELIVHADGHHDFRAKEESTDLYAAIDLVAETLHKHLARQKDKRVRGRRGTKRVSQVVPLYVSPLVPDDYAETLAAPVTHVKRFTPRSMTVEEAVDEMEQKNFSFLVFLNDDTINIIYKRKDKTYGIIEPNL